MLTPGSTRGGPVTANAIPRTGLFSSNDDRHQTTESVTGSYVAADPDTIVKKVDPIKALKGIFANKEPPSRAPLSTNHIINKYK